jgi:threonine/homoserine efflux transporter RhtA
MAALMGLVVLGQHISLLEGAGLSLVIAASVGVTLGGGEAAAEPVAAT